MLQTDPLPKSQSQTSQQRPGIILIPAFAGYFFLKPFYVFESGLPQIADFLMMGLLGLVLLKPAESMSNYMPLLWRLIAFVFYVFLVNMVWAIILQNYEMLKPPVFYLFNIIIFFTVLRFHLLSKQSFLKLLILIVSASIVFQCALSFLLPDRFDGRQVLFFNNPNQLAYWTLLSASIFFICANELRVKLVYQFAMILPIGYLLGLSLSKAAMVSFCLLLLIQYSRKAWHLLFAAVFVAILLVAFSDSVIFENVMFRIENIGKQSDDGLAGRGYLRIFSHPHYLFLGAGEFGFERFRNPFEMHSTIGTVIFSYGIIGTALFFAILWRLYRMAGLRLFFYLAPAFAYGLTHQGLRFSLLWVLFAVVAIIGVTRAEHDTVRQAADSDQERDRDDEDQVAAQPAERHSKGGRPPHAQWQRPLHGMSGQRHR